MGLTFGGIDEAGYGPMLGPLCVASACFHVQDWKLGDSAPDLWQTLSETVSQSKRASKTHLVIADSKKVKLPNNSFTKHPLYHLERAVLAFLGARDGTIPETDIELFDTLGATLDPGEWSQGTPIELPLGKPIDELQIDVSHLKTVCHRKGVSLGDLRVQVTNVSEFNELIRTHRSKAITTQRSMLSLLESIDACSSEDYLRVVCDRQSGRTQYLRQLQTVFPDIESLEESARASRYKQTDQVGVLFTPKADDAYFPVAFASMAAKLVRELMMIRFNQYWSKRQEGIRPTAGYVQDARRWLHEMGDTLSKEERDSIIRIA